MALRQPPLRPPPWIFGPVWTVLYGYSQSSPIFDTCFPSPNLLGLTSLPISMMGYAAYRVANIGLSPFSSPDTIRTTRHSMTVYTIQLALNLAWMPLFFGARRPVAATVDILALVGVNGYLTYLWSSIDQVAAWCQVPYLAWLGFATYLCAGVGHLNGWDLSDKTVKKEGKQN